MRRGFSLVELSIVLVILGLLAGGILAGRSLVKASELRAQMRDIQTLATAHYSFRDKYLCMRGDCSTVSRFFSTISNGNEDGRVDCWPGSGTNECGTYIISLESAGLLEARRRPNNSNAEYRNGVLNNTYLYLHYQDRYAGGGYTPGTLLGSGRAWIHLSGVNDPWAQGAALEPDNTWNMDQKADDGMPYTGKYVAVNGAIGASYVTNCTSGTTYLLSTEGAACRAFYKIE